MFTSVFYHQTIRRAVAVFGTVFNNLNIIRRDASGNMLNTVKVPLAYGPKQKFLARIDQQEDLSDPKIAIKLPRMSFELTSMTYDSNTKMQKGSETRYKEGGALSNKKMLGPVGYRLGIQLSILTKNQDDALQILEQILPYFQPEYTVTVRQVDDSVSSDMPITLQSVNISDEYDSDFNSRRVILYTLDFETKVRFFGPVVDGSIIKKIITNIIDDSVEDQEKFLARQDVYVAPFSATNSKDDLHTILVKNVGTNATQVVLEVEDAQSFAADNQIVGLTSATVGDIVSININSITVSYPDDLYIIGETVSILGGSVTSTVVGYTEIFNE
jgi:hypothetical protein